MSNMIDYDYTVKLLEYMINKYIPELNNQNQDVINFIHKHYDFNQVFNDYEYCVSVLFEAKYIIRKQKIEKLLK